MLLQMEFHQLRYFVAAAEELNISKAASRLHVTQPAMSRQIAVLEDELGVALFDRVRKRIHLTEAGRFFLVKAQQILCDAETSIQQTRERFGHASPVLRAGFVIPLLDDVIGPAIREFRQSHADVQVSLFELSPRAQLNRLRDGELDIAILGNIIEAERECYHITVLGRFPMAAVLPESHPFALRPAVALSELRNEAFVSLSEESFPGRRDFLKETGRRAGFEPLIRRECDSVALVTADVAAGEGVALLPHHAAKLPHGGCVFVRLADPAPTVEALAVLRRETVGERTEAMALVDSLVAATRQVLARSLGT